MGKYTICVKCSRVLCDEGWCKYPACGCQELLHEGKRFDVCPKCLARIVDESHQKKSQG